VDWTERRPHIAGALGSAICSRFLMLKWIVRRRNTRALRITDEGAHELRRRFGVVAGPLTKRIDAPGAQLSASKS